MLKPPVHQPNGQGKKGLLTFGPKRRHKALAIDLLGVADEAYRVLGGQGFARQHPCLNCDGQAEQTGNRRDVLRAMRHDVCVRKVIVPEAGSGAGRKGIGMGRGGQCELAWCRDRPSRLT
jgi:hypothetical protein